MGTPALPISPDGEAHFCWTPGYNFTPGPTKKLIFVEFSGIQKSAGWVPLLGEPINGIFTLQQVSPIPYWNWNGIDPDWLLHLYLGPDSTMIEARGPYNRRQFFDYPGAPCVYEFENDQADPLFYVFYGGTAKLWIQGFNI